MLWLACSPESLAYQYLVCLVIAYRFSKPNAAVSETLFFYFWGEFHLKQTQNPRSLTHLIFICFFQTFTKNIYSPSSCIITFISIPLESSAGGGGRTVYSLHARNNARVVGKCRCVWKSPPWDFHMPLNMNIQKFLSTSLTPSQTN